jgi:tetratricopeptide (TPR) repeat protein
LDPDLPALASARAETWLELGELDLAMDAYDEAVGQQGDEPSLLAQRAEVWRRRGDRAQALLDLHRALDHDPDCVEALLGRARVYAESADRANLEAALADAEAALEQQPASLEAHAARISLLRRLARSEDALRHASEAITLFPGEANLYLERALVRRARGEAGDASTDLRYAEDLTRARLDVAAGEAHEHPALTLELVLYLIASGRPLEARKLAADLLAHGPPRHLLQRAVERIDTLQAELGDGQAGAQVRAMLTRTK